jgi:hypothetical protein
VHPLATQKRIDLQWHVVCGRYELEELTANRQITPCEFNHRQNLFETIKYPGQLFYKGSWGPERLYYDKEDNFTTGQLGKVYCTDSRYEEIRQWFLDHVFESKNNSQSRGVDK